MIYPNMDWNTGDSSTPGINPIVYFVPKGSITSWPQLSEDKSSLEGDFVLEDTAVWTRFNCVSTKAEPVSEPQGEIRCKTFNNKLTVITTLTNEAATSFAAQANNDDLVFAFREADSGRFRIVGSENFLGMVEVGTNIGGDPTAERGTTLNISATDKTPFPYYDGLITDSDGEVQASATGGGGA